MTNTTHINRRVLEAATALSRRGLVISAIEITTPDGRTWSIDPVATGDFRLFEIDPEFRRGPEEHDAVSGDAWCVSDLTDYLDAVGRPRGTT